MRPRQPPTALVLGIVVLVIASGCFGGAPAGAPGERPPAPQIRAPPEAPSWKPNPPVGVEPPLKPGSAWVPTEFGFVRSDFRAPANGTSIIVSMDGYAGAGEPTHYVRVRDGILIGVDLREFPRNADEPFGAELPSMWMAYASLRGTGCSGGAFTLLDPLAIEDGHEVVEWAAWLPWSADKVALRGASYSALTAAFIAGTDPPSLGAVAISATMSDPYRDVAFPGGILNEAFAGAWSAAARPASSLQGTGEGLQAQDEICAFHAATRPPGDVPENPYLQFASGLDGPYWRVRSPVETAPHIRAPILFTDGYQDEEIASRGSFALYEATHPDPVWNGASWVEPKALLTTNGGHFTSHSLRNAYAQRWIDHFLLGTAMDIPFPGVRVHLGVEQDGPISNQNLLQPLSFVDLDGTWDTATTWLRLNATMGGRLARETGSGAPDSYAAGSPRDSWFGGQDVTPADTGPVPVPEVDMRGIPGPDILIYKSTPWPESQLIAGPATATIWLSATATDTDVFVRLVDVWPDGSRTPITWGLLRASHRALDPARTWWVGDDVVRPYHSHSATANLVPNQVARLDVELMPVGHVVYTGHALEMWIGTPPLDEGLSGYSPIRTPSVNSVVHDGQHATRLLLPIAPVDAEGLPPEPPCGQPMFYACIPPR